jgi:hypothetical protein
VKTLRSIALTGALLLLACTARAQWVDSTTAWFDYTGGTVVPSGYLTIRDETTSLAQEGILTFLGSTVTCVDNPSNLATECTFTGGAGGSVATDTIWDAAGDLVYGTGADTASKLAKGTATQLLHSGTTPSWSAVDLAADVTGVLPFANITNGSALSLFGRSANSSGVQASVTASAASDCVFRESGSALGCGTVATAGIANSAVTLAKVAPAAASSRLLGSGSSGAGAAYTEIPLGAPMSIGADVTGTTRLGFDPTKQWYVYDDFLNVNGVINNDQGEQVWGFTNTNSAGLSKVTGEANHPGVFRATGVAGNNATYMVRKDANSLMVQGGEVIEWMIRIDDITASGTKWGCGLGDSVSDPSGATDGLQFIFDPSTDAHWGIRNRKAGTGNTSNSTTTVTDDTWWRLTIVVNAAATSVAYYVNGTELNNSPLSSNIPTAVSTAMECGVVQLGSLGAAALLDVDYAWGYGPLTR